MRKNGAFMRHFFLPEIRQFPAFLPYLPYALALPEQCRSLGITLTFYPFITQ